MNSLQRKILDGMFIAKNGDNRIGATGIVIAHQAIFSRLERPDYSLKCGEYCYSRVSDRLRRSEFFYAVNGTRLKGYYYAAEKNLGLVIISHGIKSGADDYLPIIESVVNAGFNALAYDVTGTYDSEGASTVGMCQSIIDLEGTVKYVQQSGLFRNMPIFLIGHSWGAYAAASVLALCNGISACAAIAGMNNGCTIMTDKAAQYVGDIGDEQIRLFDEYQRMLFGNYADCSALSGINSVEAPVLVAHGVDDKVIAFASQSIISHRDEMTNPNVEFYVGRGEHGGHDSIWHSAESMRYQKEIELNLKKLTKKKGERITDEEKAELYKTVDHRLYSEPNGELMDMIVNMFYSTLNK